MSEPKRSNFLPKWARDGRWELGEFPNIGAADEEDEVSERTLEEIMAEAKAFEHPISSRTAVVFVTPSEFAALLRAESIDHPDPPRECPTIRYREAGTERWIIVECRWDRDRLQVGWPPLASTNDCEIGELK